ncbi:MAG: hypothetical protein R2702_13490 [Acidimicrobiales bacterium]
MSDVGAAVDATHPEPAARRRGLLAELLDGPRVPIGDAELLVLVVCNLVSTVGLAGDIARHLQTPTTSRATSSRAGTWCSTAA